MLSYSSSRMYTACNRQARGHVNIHVSSDGTRYMHRKIQSGAKWISPHSTALSGGLDRPVHRSSRPRQNRSHVHGHQNQHPNNNARAIRQAKTCAHGNHRATASVTKPTARPPPSDMYFVATNHGQHSKTLTTESTRAPDPPPSCFRLKRRPDLPLRPYRGVSLLALAITT